MRDEEIREKLNNAAGYLVEESYELIFDEELNRIIMQEIGDRLEPAFTEVAGRIGEIASEVAGSRVEAKFLEYEFIGEGLFVSSRYRLLDTDSGVTGEARLIGYIDVDSEDVLGLRPISRGGAVIVEMYGGDTDRLIEEAITRRLSQELIRITDFREILEALAVKYKDLLHEGAEQHENYVRIALSAALDVSVDNVAVRVFDVEVEPEAKRIRVHYLFRANGVEEGVDVAGRITVSGRFWYVAGVLKFVSNNVSVKYKVLNRD